MWKYGAVYKDLIKFPVRAGAWRARAINFNPVSIRSSRTNHDQAVMQASCRPRDGSAVKTPIKVTAGVAPLFWRPGPSFGAGGAAGLACLFDLIAIIAQRRQAGGGGCLRSLLGSLFQRIWR